MHPLHFFPLSFPLFPYLGYIAIYHPFPPAHFPPTASKRSAMVDTDTPRKPSTVPEIRPLDRYDFGRAKICASVRWLLITAYGSGGKEGSLRYARQHPRRLRSSLLCIIKSARTCQRVCVMTNMVPCLYFTCVWNRDRAVFVRYAPGAQEKCPWS